MLIGSTVALECSAAAESSTAQLSVTAQAAPTPDLPTTTDPAKAKQQQEGAARQLGLPLEVTNSIGMKLVLVPAGEFEMGTPESFVDRNPDEYPHRVRITKAFYLSVCEVTQGEYERVMGKNPSYFSPTGWGKDLVLEVDTGRFPVESVSWDDAVAFCAALSAREEEAKANREYGLPTEAQWEYACRSGSPMRFCCGDDKQTLGDFAWFVENSGRTTHPVGTKRPNAWGLHDMHGNVREWCHDWHADDYYRTAPIDDPPGPLSGLFRVFRGGCFCLSSYFCRSGNRFGPYPLPSNMTGFRVVAVIPSP